MTYHAVYEASIGDRKRNEFIRKAGLGVAGLFYQKTIVVDWKPNQEVTEDRAQALCGVLKGGLNDFDTECSKVELVRLYADAGNEKGNG